MTGLVAELLRPSLTDKARAYVRLTKPRIMVLLLVTTAAAMLLAGDGLPPTMIFLITLLGGALGAGGASAINNYMDRDIDRLMLRTASRPVPAGVVSPTAALFFGVALVSLSFLLLALAVNLLAAVLTLTGALFYVFIYTGWLKRSSVHGVVIGGAAGALPPVVGWAAVTGEVSFLAFLLFATFFIWTPPHFWALSLLMKDEYERAHVPMLPVIRGDAETHRQILWYSVALVVFSVLVGVLAPFGAPYFMGALLLGAVWLTFAIKLRVHGTRAEASELFHYSLVYLALLFALMVVDRQMARFFLG